MKLLLHSVVVASVALSLSACGNKGRLKTPAQIEAAEAKKARRKVTIGDEAIPAQQTSSPQEQVTEPKVPNPTTPPPGDN